MFSHAGGPLQVRFEALVGNEPFACGQTYKGLGADGFTFTAMDARMYVHDVALLRADGSAVPLQLDEDGRFQSDGLALLDFEDGSSDCPFGTPALHTSLQGKAPAGEYTGLRFTVGVPFDKNHQNQAVADPPLDLTSMFWSWNQGYKFLRVDGSAEEAGTVNFHLGSIGCTSESGEASDPVTDCAYPQRPTVALEGFDPTTEAVVFDIGRLFADTQSGTSCLGDPESEGCMGPLSHLGLDGGAPADVFRVAEVGPAPPPVDGGMPDAAAPDAAAPDAGSQDCQDKVPEQEWVWDLPVGFPEPPVPDDNPMSQAKVDLGRRLFFDTQLSRNEEQACASCHKPELSFTDGLAGSVGSTGQVHRRSSMSLANVGYYADLTWANPEIKTLEEQALGPLTGDSPVELGWHEADGLMALEERLRADPVYPAMFEEAFGTDCEPVSVDHITKAIAAFQRTLISGDSPYDRWWYGGDETAVSEEAKKGQDLFFEEKFECHHCHGGVNLSGNHLQEALHTHNSLYNVDGEGGYPEVDQGIIEVTRDPRDMGRFKPPSLRNIALTAPYMHDGSLATLDDVLDHYASGGAHSPLTSEFVEGFDMTPVERQQIIAFLESLTDETFLNDPRFQSPFDEEEE